MKLAYLGAFLALTSILGACTHDEAQEIAKFKGECLSQKGTLAPLENGEWKCTLEDGTSFESE